MAAYSSVYMLLVCCHLGYSLTDFERQYERKLIELEVNPQCHKGWCKNETYPDGMLAYTVASGQKDEIHHLFSTIGAPTLFMSRTEKNTRISIDYDVLLSQSGQAINYTHEPQHSFGIIFSKLYEFDDYKDEANITLYKGNSSANFNHSLDGLSWNLYKKTGDDDYQEIILNATASDQNNSTLFSQGGYISFQVRYDSKDGRLLTRPHMEHTANSSMVTVVMSDLTSSFDNSRFAVELIMISTGDEIQENSFSKVTLNNSLDDEYSPGVFQMRNWEADPSKIEPWGYAQWKPVMYTKSERLNADLSHATSYPNLPFNRSFIIDQRLPERSLYYSYFYNDSISVSLNATNVSFGQTNDKFYKYTNYTVWTMAVGLGPPPSDDVSILVILVISIGLGIPLVLMIFSTAFVCVRNRKRRNSNDSYQSINS